MRYVFYFLCIITGQFFGGTTKDQAKDIKSDAPSWRGHCRNVIVVLPLFFMSIFLLVNIGSLAFTIYDVGWCSYNKIYFYNTVPSIHLITTNSTPMQNLSNETTKEMDCNLLLNEYMYLAAVLPRSFDNSTAATMASMPVLGSSDVEYFEIYINWTKAILLSHPFYPAFSHIG